MNIFTKLFFGIAVVGVPVSGYVFAGFVGFILGALFSIGCAFVFLETYTSDRIMMSTKRDVVFGITGVCCLWIWFSLSGVVAAGLIFGITYSSLMDTMMAGPFDGPNG